MRGWPTSICGAGVAFWMSDSYTVMWLSPWIGGNGGRSTDAPATLTTIFRRKYGHFGYFYRFHVHLGL